MPSAKKKLSAKERDAFLETLKGRFEKNMARHPGLTWAKVQARLESEGEKLNSLHQMETSGGEPDLIGQDQKTGALMYCDCSAESPTGRRNACFSKEGQLKREKEGLPVAGNAMDLAAAMGVELLTEEEYRDLQELGKFDTKTSSWLKTPPKIFKLGGALFGDRRYDHVFVYHNGAPSFYQGRGFRALLKI